MPRQLELPREEGGLTLSMHAEKAIDGRAAREHLETRNADTDALREKEQELTARDEAQRLQESANRAKAERKPTSRGWSVVLTGV